MPEPEIETCCHACDYCAARRDPAQRCRTREVTGSPVWSFTRLRLTLERSMQFPSAVAHAWELPFSSTLSHISGEPCGLVCRCSSGAGEAKHSSEFSSFKVCLHRLPQEPAGYSGRRLLGPRPYRPPPPTPYGSHTGGFEGADISAR